MKTCLAKLSIGLLVCLFAATSAQAWVFEIDNLDNDLTFELWFNPEGETLGVGGYQLDFGFDFEEIEFVGYTNTAPTGLFDDFMGAPYLNGDGVLWNFNASSFAGGVDLDTRISLGSLTFGLLNPDTSVQDGLDDIWIDTSSGNALIMWSDNATATVIGAQGAGLDIGNPVPVPAAVWLLVRVFWAWWVCGAETASDPNAFLRSTAVPTGQAGTADEKESAGRGGSHVSTCTRLFFADRFLTGI